MPDDQANNSSTFLLTWNPDFYNPESDPEFRVGGEVSWSCHSKHPKKGDTVYLMRLGRQPKGIVASGTVSVPVYEDVSWKDATKKSTYIKFKVSAIRLGCAQGLLPAALLDAAFPSQNWNPQSSGTSIAHEITAELDQIWVKGKGISSLRQYTEWYIQSDICNTKWLNGYREIVGDTAAAAGISTVNDGLLERLWRVRDNDVSSVGSGQLSNDDFNNNRDFLRKITLDIFEKPTPDTYQEIVSEWKARDSFTKTNIAVIRRVFSCVLPKTLTTILPTKACRQLLAIFGGQFQLVPAGGITSDDWFVLNEKIMQCLEKAELDSAKFLETNVAIWNLIEENARQVSGNEPSSRNSISSETIRTVYETATVESGDNGPTNLILFGPPGTGKTYNTVVEAVKIFAPHAFESSPKWSDLKRIFDEQVALGNIIFTTFHQSFTYEDFVEGIKAEVNANKQITYTIKDGIFKRLCAETSPFEIGEVLGSGYIVDFASPDLLRLTKPNGSELPLGMSLLNTLATLVKDGQISLEDIKEKRVFEKVDSPKLEKHIVHGYQNILPYLVERIVQSDGEASKKPPRVLVIDEINRGNISKIFGELITLLEPKKRRGREEALSVVLPYSRTDFSVPYNVHIIATMNSTDRSLTALDVAIRRRFTFKEVPPQPELLQNTEIDGINVGLMLEALNKRIEFLLDKEHMIGHAYFMGLQEGARLADLQRIFKENIIPLLEEYFFDDHERIQLVLNDHRKDPEFRLYVRQTDSASVLFGNGPQLGERGLWIRKEEVLFSPGFYSGILGEE